MSDGLGRCEEHNQTEQCLHKPDRKWVHVSVCMCVHICVCMRVLIFLYLPVWKRKSSCFFRGQISTRLLDLWFPKDLGPCPTLVFLKFWWSPVKFNSYIFINLVSKQATPKYCMPHAGNYYSRSRTKRIFFWGPHMQYHPIASKGVVCSLMNGALFEGNTEQIAIVIPDYVYVFTLTHVRISFKLQE